MRLVFAGTPETALPALRRLIASARHDLIAVLTRPDAVSGRRGKPTPSPVARLARDEGIQILTPHRPNSDEFVEQLSALAPDCCPVVAYGALLPQSVLEIPPQGWVNLHFSLLPAWRGAAPVQHALWAGDEVTGATTFRIVKELDAGPTYGLMTEAVRPRDTAGELLARLAQGGAALLVQTLDGIEDGGLEARPQPADGVSFASKITVQDARVDWSEPALAVDRRVRACTPAPGAWTTLAGERVKLGPVLPTDREHLEPGVLEVTRTALYVGTATQPVQLGDVKPFGKRQMGAADWARGARLETGQRLGE